MRSKGWFAAAGVCVLLALTAVTARGQGPDPQTAQVALGTGFTYQGQLKKNGLPFTASCPMYFSVWDSQSNLTGQIGGIQAVNPVSIVNGNFSVVLNSANQFGPNAFTGQARWLQTAVQCAGDGGGVTLSRQPVTAAPYALYAPSAGTANNALFSSAPWQTNGSSLYYLSGNVGIGQSAPNNKLTVYGAADVASFIRVGGNTGGAGLVGDIVVRRSVNTGAYYFGDSINNYLYFDGTNYQFGQGGLYVRTNGQILMGTGSPTSGARLEVHPIGGGIGVFIVNSSGIAVWGDGGSGTGVNGSSTSGTGVSASSNSGNAIVGISGSGYAGHFNGKVLVDGVLTVTGSINAPVKNFVIDHPLDPANRYLLHTSVESPDMLNIYNGNITTDANGDASVVLPAYFEALNRDFRYQLTVVGTFAQAIIASEIEDNRFRIKSDKPNVKVSWQVTGVRHDPWAEQHRTPVELEKSGTERGKYLYPKEAGAPETLGMDYEKRQSIERSAL